MPKTWTLKIHYNSNNNPPYSITPAHTDIDPGDTVVFKAEEQSSTVCFDPDDTVFGASIDVPLNANPLPSVTTDPGKDFTVDMCATDLDETCAPDDRITATGAYTIKVGSGVK